MPPIAVVSFVRTEVPGYTKPMALAQRPQEPEFDEVTYVAHISILHVQFSGIAKLACSVMVERYHVQARSGSKVMPPRDLLHRPPEIVELSRAGAAGVDVVGREP
jgi:hypothetical protein